MFENSTDLLSKWKGKWSGNELENDFLIASILGTEVNWNSNLNVNLDLDLDLNTYGFEMEKKVNMLDQFILLVQLPAVSVINPSGYS